MLLKFTGESEGKFIKFQFCKMRAVTKRNTKAYVRKRMVIGAEAGILLETTIQRNGEETFYMRALKCRVLSRVRSL